MFRSLIFAVSLAVAGAAQAQTAPSASDMAAYTGLHLAAHEGQVAEIERLIVAGAHLDARDRAGRTPAHVAAFASHDDAVTALAQGGADMNALENRVYDVLTIAAVANDPEMVSLAMELGNKPDLITSVYDGTALIEAVVLGDGGPDHIKTVQILVEAGADKSIPDRDGVTPLQHAMSRGYTEMVALLQ